MYTEDKAGRSGRWESERTQQIPNRYPTIIIINEKNDGIIFLKRADEENHSRARTVRNGEAKLS